MGPNQKPSESIALLATIDPVSQGAGAVSTGWVNMGNFEAMLAVLDVGAFGASATVDAKLQQALDSSGTTPKDITGKAIVQMLAAGGNNKQVTIDVRETDLDTNNGYCYVRLTVTVGVAATLVSAGLWGFFPQYEPAGAYNQAGVVQQV